MTKTVLIALAAGVVVIGGAAGFILTRGEDEADQANQNSSQQQSDNSQNEASDANFSPLATDEPFKATITITTNNESTTATLESDGEGKTRYTARRGGAEFEAIYTSDAVYNCTDDGCFKVPVGQNQTGFDPADYTYTDADWAAYRSGVTYQGQKSCPAGTCDVWQASQSDGSSSTIYLDADNQRISQIESTGSSTTSTIVYEFTPVTIQIPQNVTEVPGL